MGAYLSEPVTEKISSDGCGKYVAYGASSMQGWRVTQEDAHNSILDYDTDTSFFAVYDGHGGHEVAVYTAEHYPELLKKSEKFKSGDMRPALIETFMEYDAHLGSEEGLMNLELASRDKNSDDQDGNNSSESETADSVHVLCEEAQMPLEEVMAKYHSEPKVSSKAKNSTAEENKTPSASNIKPQISTGPSPTGKEDSDGGSSSHQSVAGSSHSSSGVCDSVSESVIDNKNCERKGGTTDSGTSSAEIGSSDVIGTNACSSEVSQESVTKNALDVNASEDVKSDASKNKKCDSATDLKSERTDHSKSENHVSGTQNGNIADSDPDTGIPTLHENGDATSEEKNHLSIALKRKRSVQVNDKRDLKGEKVANVGARSSDQQATAQIIKQVYRDLLIDSSDSDSDDDTFQANDNSSDDDDDDDGEEGDGEDEDDDGDEDGSSIDGDDDLNPTNMEVPGMDSGCTAVVAVLHGRDLYVANAGDSRCVLCYKGKALDMSSDHKPEDDEEMDRIINAGGKVTPDGRVNGGLNLSRAFGDHAYKQNVHLSPEEQMITASPDVQSFVIDPEENDFMVLACDGIWNYMSSQQVVDFVRERLNKTEKLSTICEELFDHCLAPNTLGDGTGCDNMTAIIVKFLPAIAEAPQHLRVAFLPGFKSTKRGASDPSSEDAKRVKTD